MALPAVGRLWPSDLARFPDPLASKSGLGNLATSDHDDEDWRVVTGDMIEALFLVEERERPVLPGCYHSNHVHSLQTV